MKRKMFSSVSRGAASTGASVALLMAPLALPALVREAMVYVCRIGLSSSFAALLLSRLPETCSRGFKAQSTAWRGACNCTPGFVECRLSELY